MKYKRTIWERRKKRIFSSPPTECMECKKNSPQKGRPSWANGQIFYSTVTDFAKFLGLSTSNPLFLEI